MPEKTKREKGSQPCEDAKAEKPSVEKKDKSGNWGDDHREKSYYYDDGYGYEIYNAEDDDEIEDKE